MSLRHILVHVDHTRAARIRFRLAAQIGATFGSRLTGLYVRPHAEPTRRPEFAGVQISPEARAFMIRYAEEEHEREATALDLFADISREAQVPSEQVVEDEDASSAPVDRLTWYGRAADVIVMGKPDPGDPEAIGYHVPHEVLFASGVPILVVPPEPDTIGHHICVAWNGSPEATRATRDALPLLMRSRQVTVLCVNLQARYGNKQVGGELLHYLHSHGIEAALDVNPMTTDAIDDVLLDSVANLGADMLVMGAYGHSRLRRFVLGGTTKRLLEHSPVPLFMSH